MHNGTISPLTDLRALVVPESLGRLRGTTDSEMYLIMVTDRMRAGVPFLDAVRDTVATLRAAFPTASLNAVLLSHTHMVVVHSSTHAIVPTEHFRGRLLPGEELPPQHDAGYYLIRRRRAADGTLAYASSGFDQSGWDVLPLDSMAIIELGTMIETLEAVAPARAPTTTGPTPDTTGTPETPVAPDATVAPDRMVAAGATLMGSSGPWPGGEPAGGTRRVPQPVRGVTT